MKVFLTGATGVLGRPTVAKLLAAGHEVAGVARNDEGGDRFGGRRRTGRRRPLRPAMVREAVVGCDVIAHLATNVPPYPRWLQPALGDAQPAAHRRHRATWSTRRATTGSTASSRSRSPSSTPTAAPSGSTSGHRADGRGAARRRSRASSIALRAGGRLDPRGRHALRAVLRGRRTAAPTRCCAWPTAPVADPRAVGGLRASIHVDDAASAVVAALARRRASTT